MILSRRQFIQTGLAGSLLLSLSGWLNAAGARRLSVAEREMLGALCNAMLEGMRCQPSLSNAAGWWP
jgi:hypothetical protein